MKWYIIARNIVICILLVILFDRQIKIFWLAITIYILYIGFLVWLARDKVLMIKHMAETSIWGKPLKDFKPGELKNHKVKIVWSGKHDLERKDKRRTVKRNKK